jgi:hypothetical protein
MFFISPNQVLVEHILVDILWDYGWKLCEKNDTWWKEWAKLPMVDHLNKKKKEKLMWSKQCQRIHWKF